MLSSLSTLAFYLSIEANVFLVSFFASVARDLQRRIQMNALLREEQQHLEAVAHHRYQDELDGLRKGPHFWRARSELAEFRRVGEEQRMLQTGKDFWQLNDVEKWARDMRALEREKSTELFWAW